MKKNQIAMIYSNEEDKSISNKIDIVLSKLTIEKDYVKYDVQNKRFEIDNKYYSCNLEVKEIKFSILDDFLSHNNQIEGLIMICDILDANNLDVN